jgi:tetratricopeptide (TPR) repeat protein
MVDQSLGSGEDIVSSAEVSARRKVSESLCSARKTTVTSTLLLTLIAWEGRAACAGQSIAPKEPARLLTQAKIDLEQGQYAEAEKILRAGLTDHASDVEARYLLAYALFRENKPADSLKEYTEAARQRAPRATELKTVALDYVLLNDYDDAEHWARYSLSLDPNDAEAWYEFGRIEYTLNKFHAAVDAFQRALQLDPVSVKAENNLGLALEGLNRSDEALVAFRKAIAMQASSQRRSEQPLLNLAKLLIDRNQLDEALSLLQQAKQISPRDWKILAQLGRLYSEKGELSAAREALEQAVAIEPQKASLHFQLGQIYRKSGAPEKASREFATTKELLGANSSPSD